MDVPASTQTLLGLVARPEGPIIMQTMCSCLRGTNGLEGNADPSIAFWIGRAETLVRKEVVFDRHML